MAIDETELVGDYTTVRDVTISKDFFFRIQLKDISTGRAPKGMVRVSLEGSETYAVRNLEGMYFFPDLPLGSYDIRVDSELYETAHEHVARTKKFVPIDLIPNTK